MNDLKIYVDEWKTSSGADYFVTFERNGKTITPYMFKERYKAEYEVASFRHFFFDEPQPDIMDYGP